MSKTKPDQEDDRSERDFYKKPGGGLIDPQGEPKIDDDDVRGKDPATDLPSRGLGKEDKEQKLS